MGEDIYRNRVLINQRGGSIEIDNTTEAEKIAISQRSGSNIKLTNAVTSELATHNKQTSVVNDAFETVGGSKNILINRDFSQRVFENTYNIKGFSTNNQIEAYKSWKNVMKTFALVNDQFGLKRGGYGYPNGSSTSKSGTRESNPVLNLEIYPVENEFGGYNTTPIRKFDSDEVATYKPIEKREGIPATVNYPTQIDVEIAAGELGSKAPGVMKYGATQSASTEGGTWSTTGIEKDTILENLQSTLNIVEQEMGNGGDEIDQVKRNRITVTGVVFNDFPSIRIDPEGRSQPLEMVVGNTGAFKNHDFIPLVEEVDNSSNFPCGDKNETICNRQTVNVGSGGISQKTTGVHELGGAMLKTSHQKTHINATQGIHIGSDSNVDITSFKTITLRANRQIYVESALGVNHNLIVGGGAYIEGEVYLHHITAPVEVQQTEDTIVLGKFNTRTARSLVIGEANIGGNWYPVYALPTDDIIANYPHSHHFNNIPLRLCNSNSDVRKFANTEDINKHETVATAKAQAHAKKIPLTF